MKKIVLLLRFAMIIGGGILSTACAKESEEVTPVLQTTKSSNLIEPGKLVGVPVGGFWHQGPAATGLQDYAWMKLTSHKVTPKGEIDTWVEKEPLPIELRPATKLVWNTTYTHFIDGESYTFQIHCTTQTDGTMFMRTNWNLATNRSDDL